MNRKLFTNRFEYLLWFMSITFFVVGISSGSTKLTITFSAISIAIVIANIWMKNIVAKTSFDYRWLYITKAGKEIKLPLEKIEWISELPGMGISICFLGFKGSTIYGEKIVFVINNLTQSIRELIDIAEAGGHTIKYIRPW
jgi:hypothetical protein